MSQAQAVELDIGSKPSVKEVELVFINITPYYGGRHTPKTIYCLDENCSTIAYALPSVSSIKGVARWFLRTVLAYYIDPEELSKKGYASVEEQPHIDGLSLLEYIFGTTREIAFDKKRLQGFSGVLQIHVRTEFTRDQLYIHWDEINAIFRHIEEVIPDISKGIHQALTIVGSRDLRGKDHKLDRLVNTLVNVLVVCIPRLILEYLSRESARDIPRLLGKLYRDLRKAGLSRNVMSVLDSAVSSLSEALKHVFN
ncbi:MAG TPA: hypothetical protein ENG44_03600, partial [Desulfurococcaceae archaeon]|nr:hypothetical protein [Desulfurococcaceae archaeon]